MSDLTSQITKQCKDCSVVKPVEEFYKNRTCKDGIVGHCKGCHAVRAAASKRKRAAEGKDSGQWAWALRTKYGLTEDDYNRLLIEQNNVCAICQQECRRGKRLAVDHDHVTGKVRGLLCVACNVSLGGFEDDPARLLNAFAYITKKELAHV